MGADQPLIASDGLLARKSGEWAKRKLHFLRNYCGITTVAMRKKWRLRYLDVVAGPGRCKIAETGEEFWLAIYCSGTTTSMTSFLLKKTMSLPTRWNNA